MWTISVAQRKPSLKIFLEISNFLEAFLVDLKACLVLILANQHSPAPSLYGKI